MPGSKPQQIEKMLQKMAVLHLILYITVKRRQRVIDLGGRRKQSRVHKKSLGLDKKSKMINAYFFYIGGYSIVNSQQLMVTT